MLELRLGLSDCERPRRPLGLQADGRALQGRQMGGREQTERTAVALESGGSAVALAVPGRTESAALAELRRSFFIFARTGERQRLA